MMLLLTMFFASGYDQAQPNKLVPAPLSSLNSGTTIEYAESLMRIRTHKPEQMTMVFTGYI